ncbi:MAG: type VI secretion system contractile sheath small subunit [Oscillochloris sp.]|nr:type VI secretion system contractile sheath small subunit [Oscillochloris sp.]
MPIIESSQHKLDRVRPPRVQITYDVEIGDAIEQVELPFVLGIIANLSGKPDKASDTELKDREFVEIDRDNFNKIMRSIKPGLSFSTGNVLPAAEQTRLSENGITTATDAQIRVHLAFDNMDDFSPASIIQHIPELKALYDERQRLRDLQSKLDNSDDLRKQLVDHYKPV